MNTHDPPAVSMDLDRIRQKADILETNLYKAISKDDDPVAVRFQINREITPDPVIIKALIQLFPRLNIKAPKILLNIRKLLSRSLDGNEEVKIKKKLLDLSDQGNTELAHLSIVMRVIVSPKVLALEIRGTPPIPGRDGAIQEAFFDHESCPGLVKSDGVIDFREINKYPIVKAGDNLFFIAPEVQGKPGMQYDGKVIPVDQVMPMSITLRQGVKRVNSTDGQGNIRGYFLRADKTGVVVLTRSGAKISDIEVRDALDIKRLDYSIGNIGTQFICPISMTIDTICAGFIIRARGAVTVRELEGGEIKTDSHAAVHSAHPDSRITAETDITVRFSRQARLTAVTGGVTVGDELMDTHADGKFIRFEKPRAIFSGNTLDAHHILLKNLYFSGENNLYFGHRLFKEKQDLFKTRTRLKDENRAREKQQNQIMEDIHQEIKLLSKILKTHVLLRDNLRRFILATQNMEYDILYRELDHIGQTMNTKEVTTLKKHLDLLREIPKKVRDTAERSRAILDQIAEKETEMIQMELEIDGFLRRASTLKIFTPKKGDDDTPALFIESKSDRNTRIRITGKYTRDQGFVIARE